jgi:hypothetical protein
MGLASQHHLAIRSTTRAPKDAINLETPRASREHRRRKSAIQVLDGGPKAVKGTQDATDNAGEKIVNVSFTSSDSHSSQNGSTPKRSKLRPSFKVPAMHTPYAQKPIIASRSIAKKLSPSKRSALRQLSPNRRHTTPGFTVPENQDVLPNDMRSMRKIDSSPQGAEEVDFDMEDFLACTLLTPGDFASGTGRVPDDEDGTLTEL